MEEDEDEDSGAEGGGQTERGSNEGEDGDDEHDAEGGEDGDGDEEEGEGDWREDEDELPGDARRAVRRQQKTELAARREWLKGHGLREALLEYGAHALQPQVHSLAVFACYHSGTHA